MCLFIFFASFQKERDEVQESFYFAYNSNESSGFPAAAGVVTMLKNDFIILFQIATGTK